MKKLVLPALFTITFGFAQLHVSNDTFIYVQGEQLFVGDFNDTATDINLEGTLDDYSLENNGYIFLRNEAMIFQTSSANTTDNTGLGKVSVYQEGTSDNFDYNYWGVPVHLPGSLNFRFTQLFDPDVLTSIEPIPAVLSSNKDGATGDGEVGGTDLNIATRWLFKYPGSVGYENWVFVGNTGGEVEQGLGFSMKGTSGTGPNNTGSAQRYDFRGVPNTGDITISVQPDLVTLAGNPYPSALDLKTFLVDNQDNLAGGAYFWQQDPTVDSHKITDYVGGYGTYVPGNPLDNNDNGAFTQATFVQYDATGNTEIPGAFTNNDLVDGVPRYAPIGQGFMLVGADGSTQVSPSATFSNSQRVFVKESEITGSSDTSSFNRAKGEVSLSEDDETNDDEAEAPKRSSLRFQIGISNGERTLYKEILLAFDTNYSTDGIDWGTDGKDFNPLENDVYWPIEKEKFVIQSTNFEVEKEIPLAMENIVKTRYRIRLIEKENFDETQAIFLLDKENDIYYNVTNVAVPVTLDPGLYQDRFVITFVNKKDQNTEEELLFNSSFEILHANQERQLIIRNLEAQNINNVTVFDINGKRIFTEDLTTSNDELRYNTSSYSNGVYLVTLTTDENKSTTQKFAVSN
ncbi:T9SS type A sorting domain-containing protein [Ascidiimonas sp. W6]|uniref:T9SS type A sorting domain-containing protein n=1 Tax=Ascidiimonas meishanensis TaxID=3128903 RepID=UPI0030EB3990